MQVSHARNCPLREDAAKAQGGRGGRAGKRGSLNDNDDDNAGGGGDDDDGDDDDSFLDENASLLRPYIEVPFNH